jgi:hypothetical protein
MPGNVVSLDARRPMPPESVRFEPTPLNTVLLTVVLDDGDVIEVNMSPEQAGRVLIQGTHAFDSVVEATRREEADRG